MSENNVTVPHNLVTAVDHVGIAVPDFDAAVEWYRANMGFVNYHEAVSYTHLTLPTIYSV